MSYLQFPTKDVKIEKVEILKLTKISRNHNVPTLFLELTHTVPNSVSLVVIPCKFMVRSKTSKLFESLEHMD